MFSFFTKKYYVADQLSRFVDIHNHILPGIDDGAKSVTDSIELIKAFGEFGVHNFIATPHIMNNVYENNRTTINGALLALENELLERKMKDVTIAAAAEHMIDDNFENLIDQQQLMPIREKYVLVEMSYLQPPINFDEAIIKLASRGYFPVLAHPERYGFLSHNYTKYRGYKEQGILFQLNLLSLGDYYGNDINKNAFRMLEEGLIDFVASDIHNMRQMEALKDLSISKKGLRQLQPIINKTIAVFY